MTDPGHWRMYAHRYKSGDLHNLGSRRYVEAHGLRDPIVEVNVTEVADPVATERTPSGRTHEGGPGFARNAKSELFLLAVTNMVAENTFYETAGARDDRFEQLVRQVTLADPDWMARFVPWLRSEANMRSASVVVACEAVKARLDAAKQDDDRAIHDSFHDAGINRRLIDGACQRADEPGEILAYWTSRYGRALPKPVKRGVADAVARLYSERCVTPDTLVLKRDLSWVRAGELEVGDELVGFDEQVRSPVKGRASKMRVATVTATRRAILETVRVQTDRGETSVSVDHQFVISRDRKREWRRAGDLRPGDRLIFFGSPWGQDASRDAGWMAGFLDGEGSVSNKCVYVSQVVGDTCEYAKEVLKRLGFNFSVLPVDKGERCQPQETLKILGGRYESMRLLGTIGGVRLSRDRLWLDGDLVSKGPWVKPGSAWAIVEAVDNLGLQENVTMSTSTSTFIGDGFLCHNSLLKYDSDAKGFRFGDVIDLVHPAPHPDKPWQGELFRYALDRRHNRENLRLPEGNRTLAARQDLMALPVGARRALLLNDEGPGVLADAGMTWETLAGWLQSPMDAAAWEAIIPSMGIMALARNLRNFDQAGVSDAVAASVAAKFADAEQVARSRMLPFRWLSAHRAAPSLRWSYPLEQALGHSLANIPQLAGRTLILVDTSTSMDAGFSKDGTLMRWDAAALFGIALGHRCAHADVVSFSSAQQFYGDRPGPRTKAFPMTKGESVLRSLQRWKGDGYFLGGGTDTAGALRSTFARHDRVVIVTDEQAAYDPAGVSGSIPANVPMFTWNLAGYQVGHAKSGGANRHTFGGLTDQGFKMIPLLEAGASQSWPF